MGGRLEGKDDAVVRVVLELLATEGYDAVQLRVVAQRAQVSLRTIYRYFPTRDDLIVAALSRWMDANTYAGFSDPPEFGSLYEGLMWGLRRVFEPWERSPAMLAAYHRARSGPGGERLDEQGFAVVEPAFEELMRGLDPGYVDDVRLLLPLVVYSAMAQVVNGELDVTDLVRVVERAVYRLTADNTAESGWVLDRSIGGG